LEGEELAGWQLEGKFALKLVYFGVDLYKWYVERRLLRAKGGDLLDYEQGFGVLNCFVLVYFLKSVGKDLLQSMTLIIAQ
jgi:hypothetical protein